MSVATIRGAAIKHHILNSVLYSMSVCPGQWAESTGGSQPYNKKYVITNMNVHVWNLIIPYMV